MTNSVSCPNCDYYSNPVSLSLTGHSISKDAELAHAIHKGAATNPFTAGVAAAVAALDRLRVFHFYYCPACHHIFKT